MPGGHALRVSLRDGVSGDGGSSGWGTGELGGFFGVAGATVRGIRAAGDAGAGGFLGLWGLSRGYGVCPRAPVRPLHTPAPAAPPGPVSGSPLPAAPLLQPCLLARQAPVLQAPQNAALSPLLFLFLPPKYDRAASSPQ